MTTKDILEKVRLIKFGLLEDGYQEINVLVELCDEILESGDSGGVGR